MMPLSTGFNDEQCKIRAQISLAYDEDLLGHKATDDCGRSSAAVALQRYPTIACARVVELLPALLSVDDSATFVHTIVVLVP